MDDEDSYSVPDPSRWPCLFLFHRGGEDKVSARCRVLIIDGRYCTLGTTSRNTRKAYGCRREARQLNVRQLTSRVEVEGTVQELSGI